MKILHLNTYNTGGAAKACLRLHQGLLNAGIDSEVLILYKTKNDIPKVFDFRDFMSSLKQKQKKVQNKLLSKKQKYTLRKFPNANELFSFPESVWDITEHPKFKEADIIHLHWVVGFMDYHTFFKKCSKPIVWTFHDYEPFSGGFHYDFNVNKKPMKELIDANLLVKEKGIGEKKINVVTPSRFLFEYSDYSFQSGVFKSSNKRIISNGIIRNEIVPIDMGEARKRLALPLEKKIVLFLSDYLFYKRKGLSYLLEAATILNDSNVLFCLVGDLREEKIPIQDNIIHFSATTDTEKINLFYAASDLYVNPSLADISSNTVMEAQTAGCPVVAFNTGGIPELADKSVYCELTNENTPKNLAEVMGKMLSATYDRGKISKEAYQQYDINLSVPQFINLYQENCLPSNSESC
jgi:glycosyltransferase involved in cell wall biosynthesis